MIRIFKSKEVWHLIDDRMSADPIRYYDDINELLEDLAFLLETYNRC